MNSSLEFDALRRRFVLLTVLRWIPSGVTIPVTVLYALSRGLTLGQFGLAVAVQGVVVLLLELPSGSLADSWGRRPVLIAAGVAQTIALVVLCLATSAPMFAVAYGVMGVFRALDSGALEAWYADAALALDPHTRLERGLSAAGTAIGLGIGGGALLSSGVVLLAPLVGQDPFQLPLLIAAGLAGVQCTAVIALLHEEVEPSRVRGVGRAMRDIPAGLAEGVRTLKRSRVLTALVAVELFWGFGMVAFEALTPVKVGQTIGDADAAAALMGPVAAVAWLVFAVGSALVGRLARRFDVAMLALALRPLQGGLVILMGLATGTVGVVVAYLTVYSLHGASGPLHNTLLHREVTGGNRATVLSMNSMVAQPAGAVGAIVLGAIADHSVTAAIVVGGIVLAAAAPLYLPARRRPMGEA